jgi:hypothetical protein
MRFLPLHRYTAPELAGAVRVKYRLAFDFLSEFVYRWALLL